MDMGKPIDEAEWDLVGETWGCEMHLKLYLGYDIGPSPKGVWYLPASM
jgi:hypothetical protein